MSVGTVTRHRAEQLENWGLFPIGGEDIFKIVKKVCNIC